MLAEKLRFLVAGGSTTLFSYALYAVLLYLNIRPGPAYAVAYIAGIAWAYAVNSLWVFKAPLSLRRFLRFPLVYMAQAIASFALFYLLQSVLGMHPLLAPILVTVLLLPLTYLLSKLVLVGRDPQVRERSERSPPEP